MWSLAKPAWDRLGQPVGWLSRLGQDASGDFVPNTARREGVDVSHVVRDASRSTGFMLKGRSLDGQDPAIDYYRRGSAASALSVADFDAPRFACARHLHLTGIALALSASSAALVAHANSRSSRQPELWTVTQEKSPIRSIA